MNKENKKILAINKPISELTEKEVDEIIKELVKNGSLHHSDLNCPLDDCDCEVFYADFHQEDCSYYN